MSSSAEAFDLFRQYLPTYLNPTQARDLFSELSKFPDNQSVYLHGPVDGPLQGDGWKGLVAINFHTGARKVLSGVILSNSCDISPDYAQNHPVNLLFSPLIELKKYTERLSAAGKSNEQIGDICQAIRRQKVTDIFYLPELPEVLGESIILLHDIHAHPLDDFLKQERSLLFTLNQYGFYLFLMKLSIHFSRFNEKVQRYPVSPAQTG